MRLIDADALAETFAKVLHRHDSGAAELRYGFAKKTIDNAPTVDAVEVVRCKDCKWYAHDGDCAYCDSYASLMDHVGDETFCSYGERREVDGRGKT